MLVVWQGCGTVVCDHMRRGRWWCVCVVGDRVWGVAVLLLLEMLFAIILTIVFA